MHHEYHGDPTSKLNWLRAAVLGSNDGIVSVASIVAGVAGASDSSGFILTAGIAGLTAGALSMAVGEYVSVSTQRDTEKALLVKERRELEEEPEAEFEELVGIYERKGMSHETAKLVAKELTEHDAFAAHVDAELNIDPNDLTNPWQAAVASGASFVSGGIIPLLAIMLVPDVLRIPVLIGAVVIALAVTGWLSAWAGGAHRMPAIVRNISGGLAAMVVTYGIGRLFGVVGI
ncbi:MAG: vacuolar iron transporter family protein [Patescibacteria group bacterium]|jgi:VIT1/CCC1 family predicted Fe2+/Mn2+ transporter|nr:vacuolar iron transporter family protein [Patescibacteria group bacterium]